MRDIALTLIFAAALPFALRRTWIAVLLWTWVSLMNPHRLTYGFAHDMPWAAIVGGAGLLSIAWNWRDLRLPRDYSVGVLVMFMVWMCITTIFAIYPERSLPDLDRALKIQLMTVVALLALRERKHIDYFIWVIVLSIGFYGAKGGLFTIATGGSARVWGPSGSFIMGNNELAVALVTTIPLMNYLRLVTPNRWIQRALLACMLLSAAAALGTQSRGALLAIIAMGLVLWLRSSKKFVGAVVIVFIGFALIAFMPQSWEERMSTIGTYQEDGSAQSRLNSWTLAFRVANDRLTGAGFLIETPEINARYAPNPDALFTAHSIYFQALGEHGWIGLILFVALGALTWRNASRLRRVGRAQPETAWLADLGSMLQVSMAGFAVGGAFLSLTYFDLPYNLLVVAVVARQWLTDQSRHSVARSANSADPSFAPRTM